MNRTSAAAIAAAAVVGVAGGTYAASQGIGPGAGAAGDQRTVQTPVPATPTRSEATPTPSSPAQLLYMDSRKIHDGYSHVAVSGIDIKKVSSLVRIAGGWLVVTATGPDETAYKGTVVAANGDQTDLGAFAGHWDINEDGTQFLAQFGDGYRVTNLMDPAAVNADLSGPAGATATATAAFAASAVLTGWTSSPGDQTTVRTDLGTGRRKLIPTGSLTGWTASPRGLLMAGDAIDEATTCLSGGRVLGDHADWWHTCDWRGYGPRPQYTPDGERLLVVPSDTDGFGPTLYGVLDSETGEIQEEIALPDWTVNAEWGDNDEVFVLVQKNGDAAGRSIYRCRVGDECTTERESSSRLVLGAGV